MTRDASRSRRSLPAIAAATTLAAATLTGCSWMSPVQTDKSYAPADGVEVTLGAVKITNLLVVSSAKDAPGIIAGQVTNSGTEPATVMIGSDQGAPITTKVPAKSVVMLEKEGTTLPAVAAAPGAMTTLQIGTERTAPAPTTVPVLAPEGPYATVTPSAGAGSTGTTAPTPTETTMAPAPTETTTAPTPTDATPTATTSTSH